METARLTRMTPMMMTALGLMLLLLASISVFQTQSVTLSPVQSNIGSLMEPKTGQLTLNAPPYCSAFDFFCLIIFILNKVFGAIKNVLAVIFPFAGATAAGAGTASASTASASTASASTVSAADCPQGRDGRQCRTDQRKAERAARAEARKAARAAR